MNLKDVVRAQGVFFTREVYITLRELKLLSQVCRNYKAIAMPREAAPIINPLPLIEDVEHNRARYQQLLEGLSRASSIARNYYISKYIGVPTVISVNRVVSKPRKRLI